MKTVICLALVGLLMIGSAVIPQKAHAGTIARSTGYGALIGVIAGGVAFSLGPYPNPVGGVILGGGAGALIGLGVGAVISTDSAMLNLNRKEKFALGFPAINTNFITKKTSVSLLAYKF